MNKIRLAAFFAALVSVCLINSAHAQRGPGGFGGGGLSQILGIEGVAEDLELNDDQQEDLKDIQAKISEESQSMRESLGRIDFRNASEDERDEFMKKSQELNVKILKMERKELADFLLEHQLERLEELRIQQLGTRALSDADVIEQLDISGKQVEELQKVNADMQTKMREMFTGGNFDREKMTEMREAAEKQLLAVLSPKQTKKLEELKGDKFEFPTVQFGGQRGGSQRGRPDGNRPRPDDEDAD